MKLLPCPFCGGEPEEDGGMFFEFYGHERQDYSIACKKCRAEVRCDVGEHEGADAPCSCHHDTRKICAEKWNRRSAMLQGAENAESRCSNSPVIPECSCHACRPVTFADSRFVVCPECGNKRCPHAIDHRNACTGSNEPGQEGSAYPAAPQQE